MPQMANITVKNAANADVVFNQVTASAGDGSAARWELTAASALPIGRPYAEMVSRPNADKSARKVIPSLVCPYLITDAGTGQQRVSGNVVFRNGEMTRPRNVPDDFVAHCTAYWTGLNSSVLWKDSFNSGYSPV